MNFGSDIQLGEWLPDQENYNNGGLIECSGVYSDGAIYRPFSSLLSYSSALPSAPKGSFAFSDVSGAYLFAGTTTNLYRLIGISWSNITRTTGGNYTTGTNDNWNFVAYGTRIIASNYYDDLQSYIVNSSTNFAALGSGIPKAKYLGIINNFLVLAYTNDAVDGERSQRVWWSAYENPTSFPTPNTTAARQVQSDYNDILGSGGKITGIIGSQNYGVVFQEKNIWRMDYVGLPTVFNFSLVEDKRGCKYPRSIIGDGSAIYYIDEDGFYRFNGTNSDPIGSSKIDKWFRDNFDVNYKDNLQVAIDPIKHLIIWSFPTNGSSGVLTNSVIYNWTTNKFTLINQSMLGIFSLLTIGYTLEQLDSFGNMDTLQYSLDSEVWKGGNFALAGFLTDNTLGFFNGSNLEAVFETGIMQPNPDGRSYIDGILPYIDTANVYVSIKSKNLPSENLAYSPENLVNTVTGEANFRQENRYHGIKLRVPAGSSWSYAKSFKVKFKNSGKK